jgi:hypothetical protein
MTYIKFLLPGYLTYLLNINFKYMYIMLYSMSLTWFLQLERQV